MTGKVQPSQSHRVPSHRPRPVVAAGLGIVAGALILVGGIFEVARVSSVPNTTIFALPSTVGYWVLGLVGLLTGLLILLASRALWLSPDRHALLGTIVLLASIVSGLSLSGFVAGFLLGIVAGLAGILWVPVRGPALVPPSGYLDPSRLDRAPVIPSSSAGEDAVFWDRSFERPPSAPPSP